MMSQSHSKGEMIISARTMICSPMGDNKTVIIGAYQMLEFFSHVYIMEDSLSQKSW